MIELLYAGHLGNNLFNYALGRILAEATGHALVCRSLDGKGRWSDIERRSGIVDKLPAHWSGFEDAPQEIAGTRVDTPQLRYVMGEKRMWHGQSLNLPALTRQAPGHRVVLHGYFQRTEYYLPHAERIRRWFRLRPLPLPVAPAARDVIVHVRRSLDMRVLDRRLDVAYYRQALEELEPARVFACGLGLDTALRDALAPYAPTYLELNALETLALMTRFNRIVMANSTFSWWGAFLSEAERIVFPVPERGFMSPDRAEIDLRVPEPRYRYIEDAPLSPWRFVARHTPFEIVNIHGDTGLRIGGAAPLKIGTPELVELTRWIQVTPDSFGLYELQRAGFAPTPTLLAALARLLELGVLIGCDPHPDDPPLRELLGGGYPFGLS